MIGDTRRPSWTSLLPFAFCLFTFALLLMPPGAAIVKYFFRAGQIGIDFSMRPSTHWHAD